MVYKRDAQIFVQVEQRFKLVQKQRMLVWCLILQIEVSEVLIPLDSVLKLFHALEFSVSYDKIFQNQGL